MTQNQSSILPSSWLSKAVRSVGQGATAVGLLFAAGALTAGCLDRPVTPAVPQTTNVYISQIRQTGVDKIDLLFMIDNSISMSDKQQILAEAVPVLVQRLISPTCVDADGMPVAGNATADDTGHCPNGNGVPEFNPIKDIHIGVISSSLGDHGSNDVCSDAQNDANIAGGATTGSFYNDAAQLLPSVRTPPPYSWNNSGFLVWDPRVQAEVADKHTPITNNETDKGTFNTNFTTMVTAAGEHGCGYEAQLESWYRFLVDAEPVKTMSNNGMVSVRPKGSDNLVVKNDLVLQQRKAFLRPDSLLAIVMLTDENDCSISDEEGSQGWLVGFKGGVGQLSWHMPRARAVCATNPNDPNCRPCTNGDTDSACAMGTTLSLNEDSMNERCYNQVQRFGINLLYPAERYRRGLTEPFVDSHGTGQLPNPIFEKVDGKPSREKELVFLAGLVGVPWQDISTEASWMGPGLKYMTAQELADNKRWDVILGNPGGNPPALPSDPFMIESIDPRPTGAQNPLIPTESIQPSTGGMNKINGHEQAVLSQRDDLQFACIFPLGTAKMPAECTANSDGCDCNKDEFDKHSPLCTGVTADADGTQVSAKGYPGLRELEVLRLLENQSIVASICPKNIKPANGMTAATDPNYGYNPAVAAIVDRLKEALTVKCLPRPLTPGTAENSAPEDVGKVPCAVVEVRPKLTDTGMCAVCDPTKGRSDLTGERAKVIGAAREFLKNVGECDITGGIRCADECFCELTQFTGDDLTACQTGMESVDLYGYCYVDPEAARAAGAPQSLIDGEEKLVKDCSSTQKRILRFVGDGVPAKDGLAFIACIGANSAK